MVGGQVKPVVSVIIDSNNDNNNDKCSDKLLSSRSFYGRAIFYMRTTSVERKCLYAYDKESRLKREFVLEFHSINC